MINSKFLLAYVSEDGEITEIGGISSVEVTEGTEGNEEGIKTLNTEGSLTFEVVVTPQMRRTLTWIVKYGRVPWTYAERKRRNFWRKEGKNHGLRIL